MSPFTSETASVESRTTALLEKGVPSESIPARVAESARAVDVDALEKAKSVVGMTGSIDDSIVGSMASATADVAGSADSIAAPIAKEAFDAGSKFIKKFKTPMYLAGLAVAAAVVGKKVADRKNENDVYNATMHTMPVESGGRPYGIQEAMFSHKTGSRRKDPLVTAGVVGNLDRSKINHTSMGPDKNNHLFGG